jgi:L-alanine-DL-glutamate epimerase-like enolase superfamily enzyme
VDAGLARELVGLMTGEEAEHIERLWSRAWWALHYGGRGGPTVLAISAFDMALWDLKARRAGLPLWRMLGGFDPKVPCYAGGIDLDLPLDALLRQTDDNLSKGFRAIKMKVGRQNLFEDVERVRAMRDHLGQNFSAHGRRQHEVDDRRGDPCRPPPAALRPHLAGGADHPDDPAGHARILAEGGLPIAAGENLRSLWEFKLLVAAGGVSYPSPTSPIAAASPRS